jgi:uncharacterized protein YdeI (YjbR/CyaY-like superfamily)
MTELIEQGRVLPAGLAAFERRSEEKSAIYSYEQRKTAELDEASQKLFQKHGTAWEYFQAQPPWYRRTTAWWILSAKKEETRQKRLTSLIEASAQEQWIQGLSRPDKSK